MNEDLNVAIQGLLDALAEQLAQRVEQKLADKGVARTNDPPLEDTLSQMLGNAPWFRTMLEEVVDSLDFTHYVDRAVKKHDFGDDVAQVLKDTDIQKTIKEYLRRSVSIELNID